jgi:hypothetical protein
MDGLMMPLSTIVELNFSARKQILKVCARLKLDIKPLKNLRNQAFSWSEPNCSSLPVSVLGDLISNFTFDK